MDDSEIRPWITVVIATYNSSRFLTSLSESLKRQEAPDACGSMEILAVDGGSTDGTRDLASALGFSVIHNPAGHAIAAKHIGLIAAKSRLVCFLDHDELFTSDSALRTRFELFNRYTNLRAMISAGYRFTAEDSTSNMYASEFGDPVSMQSYGCPNNDQFRIAALSRRLMTEVIHEDSVLFRAASETHPILCEMAAGSGVVDVDYYKQVFPEIVAEENSVPHLYYLLGRDGAVDLIGVVRGDAISHDSVDSWKTVRKKISWRINNAINSTDIAASGFSGRKHSELYSPKRQLVSYVFYCVFIIGPLCDSVRLALTRRRLGYLYHFVLSYFVLFESIRLKTRSIFNKKSLSRYGEG
jgi:glycosyltransferase involved in cell wall biosynthesis